MRGASSIEFPVFSDSGLRLGDRCEGGLGALTVAFLRNEALFSSCWRCCKPMRAGMGESCDLGLRIGEEGVEMEVLE